jgi:hypothetical protein
MPTRSGAPPFPSGSIRLLAGAVSLAIAVLPARAFVEDPAPGHTGGFDEPTCRACHFDQSVNDAEGSLTLDGVPQRVQPGKTYRLIVTLERPGLARGGFQLSARFADGTLVHVAANAANDDDSQFGDFIYVLEVRAEW